MAGVKISQYKKRETGLEPASCVRKSLILSQILRFGNQKVIKKVIKHMFENQFGTTQKGEVLYVASLHKIFI